MWQPILIALIVGCALLYVVWTMMPSKLRARLRTRLRGADAESEPRTSPTVGSIELPCSNCAHKDAPHIQSH